MLCTRVVYSCPALLLCTHVAYIHGLCVQVQRGKGKSSGMEMPQLFQEPCYFWLSRGISLLCTAMSLLSAAISLLCTAASVLSAARSVLLLSSCAVHALLMLCYVEWHGMLSQIWWSLITDSRIQKCGMRARSARAARAQRARAAREQARNTPYRHPTIHAYT